MRAIVGHVPSVVRGCDLYCATMATTSLAPPPPATTTCYFVVHARARGPAPHHIQPEYIHQNPPEIQLLDHVSVSVVSASAVHTLKIVFVKYAVVVPIGN